MTSRHTRWITVASAAAVALLLTAAPCRAESAKAILDATGVRGGLVVHIGCSDGSQTAALRASDAYTVHGLARDPAAVTKARAAIREKGLYGSVSVAAFDGRSLPYVDNLVNLVVAEDLGDVPMQEVMRALAPGGVAWVAGKTTVKPRPDALDDWTHYMHDASGDCVSADTRVGPARRTSSTRTPPPRRGPIRRRRPASRRSRPPCGARRAACCGLSRPPTARSRARRN